MGRGTCFVSTAKNKNSPTLGECGSDFGITVRVNVNNAVVQGENNVVQYSLLGETMKLHGELGSKLNLLK